jgi:capsular exopolysaccharide synthesis family protein
MSWKIRFFLLAAVSIPAFTGYPVNTLNTPIIPGVTWGWLGYWLAAGTTIFCVLGGTHFSNTISVSALITLPVVFVGGTLSYLVHLSGLGQPGDPAVYSAHYVSLCLTMLTVIPLALSLVAKHKKVVLIDGNFRQPMLQKIFPKLGTDAVGAQYGLSNLLLGQCTIRQGLRATGVEGLDLLDTGLLPPNPMELLSSPRMDTLIQELRKVYDHIILDSAPVLLVSDAKVLARLADATVLVLNADGTRRGAALRVLNEMRAANARVAGALLFGARSLSGGYFREQQRSYQDYMQTA